MGILAAILAHARRIALDVARLLRRVVEGRREQLDDLQLVVDEELGRRLHRRARARRIAAARHHAPRLGDRVDLAFVGIARAERRAVVDSCRADTIRRPRPRSPAPASAGRHACPRPWRAWRRHAPCAMRMKLPSVFSRNQPSQTLSPLPSSPTRFMPSFQSPPRISGRPLAPVRLTARSSARTQCS